MKLHKINDSVYKITATASDFLFESIWPVPHGVMMNSYLVKGDNFCAVIDGVCGWDGVPETLYEALAEADMKPEDIDYVVFNHLEPDHTGWLESFVKIHSDFTLVSSAKGLELAKAFYGDSYRTMAVKNGDVLELGGAELEFQMAPNIHWPETMFTLERTTGTLFTCDGYGAYGIFPHTDTPEFYAESLPLYKEEALRYYANILGAFHGFVAKGLDVFADRNVRVIAPAHGTVFASDPDYVKGLFARFTEWSKGNAGDSITLLYSSMYGSTDKATAVIKDELTRLGVRFEALNIPETHVSFVLPAVLRARGVIIAAPTYEYKMFPPMAAVIDDIGRKKIEKRKALYVGSYGWSGGAEKELNEIVESYKLGWSFGKSVTFKGNPTEDDLEKTRAAVRELADRIG